MKEQWIVEAEQKAKDLAEILLEQITDEDIDYIRYEEEMK